MLQQQETEQVTGADHSSKGTAEQQQGGCMLVQDVATSSELRDRQQCQKNAMNGAATAAHKSQYC